MLRTFYRSGVECTSDMGDILPALRLALGVAQDLEGQRCVEITVYIRSRRSRLMTAGTFLIGTLGCAAPGDGPLTSRRKSGTLWRT